MERFDLERFPQSESGKRMLESVSENFYEKSYVAKWLFEVMGKEYDSTREIVEDLVNQLFPETATWGLAYHEIKWGLPVRENLDYLERRKKIYQKRDQKTPNVPWKVESKIKQQTGATVRVCDGNDLGPFGYIAEHANTFKVYVLDDENVDMRLIKQILNEMKQSHTTFIIDDRMEVELKNILEMRIEKMVFHSRLSFFDEKYLNGYCLLDGSGLLSTSGTYDARALIRLKNKVKANTELQLRTKNKNPVMNNEIVGVFAKTITKIKACDVVKQKILTKLSSRNEKGLEVEVITKSVNFKLLDGGITLNGSNNLNSIFRKEKIQ